MIPFLEPLILQLILLNLQLPRKFKKCIMLLVWTLLRYITIHNCEYNDIFFYSTFQFESDTCP